MVDFHRPSHIAILALPDTFVSYLFICCFILLQMRIAYDAIILREQTAVLHPEDLYIAMDHHHDMIRVSHSIIVM